MISVGMTLCSYCLRCANRKCIRRTAATSDCVYSGDLRPTKATSLDPVQAELTKRRGDGHVPPPQGWFWGSHLKPSRAQESPQKVTMGVQLIAKVPEAFKPSERPMSSTAHDQILPNKEEVGQVGRSSRRSSQYRDPSWGLRGSQLLLRE